MTNEFPEKAAKTTRARLTCYAFILILVYLFPPMSGIQTFPNKNFEKDIGRTFIFCSLSGSEIRSKMGNVVINAAMENTSDADFADMFYESRILYFRW